MVKTSVMAKMEVGRNGGKLLRTEKGDPSPNPEGRGKGVLNSKTIIRRWLEAVETAKNPINGILEKLSQLDIITLKQLEKARKGDTTAFKELLDRMEGKPQQNIDATTNGKDLNTVPLLLINADTLTQDQLDKYINKDRDGSGSSSNESLL